MNFKYRGYSFTTFFGIAAAMALLPAALTLCPSWEPTYAMNRSTYTGYVDLNYTGVANDTLARAAARHGLVTISWMTNICNNARIPLPTTPNNTCLYSHTDESLREQARLLKSLRPSTRVLVYRNCALALTIYGEQCAKMYDPSYSSWWLRENDTATHPILDQWIDPTKLTFHLATCARQPNTTHRMHQFLLDFRKDEAQQWLLDDLRGLLQVNNSAGADGIWLDDTHAFNEHHDEEIGYSAAAIAAIENGLQFAARNAQQQLVKEGKWVYHYDNNVLIPPVNRNPAACVSALMKGRQSNHLFQTMQIEQFLPAEQTGQAPTTAHDFQQNLAAFLLVRGDYSYFGAVLGPVGGSDAYVVGGVSYFAPEFDYDYGVPLGVMQETSKGVYAREWSRVTVSLDCNRFEANFEWK